MTGYLKHPNCSLNIDVIRRQFPVLSQKAHGCPLIYLDNAATTQKPARVISALNTYYETSNANVHRAAHFLSARATHAFEDARESVRKFLNARHAEEIIWTRGTTESINLVAQSWGESQLREGDEILLSRMEHHANIVPWQLAAKRTGAVLKVIELDEMGNLDLGHFRQQLSSRTKLVAITQASNAIGTATPLKIIVQEARAAGALVLVDGAQAVAHGGIDVQALDCDFYAFSGHKVFGPTGVGILYGRRSLLERMPPWQSGGEMIEKVSFQETTFNRLPFKFEAGTPNIAGAIGLAEALGFVQEFDAITLQNYELDLLKRAESGLSLIKGIELVGQARQKVPVISFVSQQIHNQDLGLMLDQQGIAVRTGHHCAMPLMDFLKLQGTVRASFSIYNTHDEIDSLLSAVEQIHAAGIHKVADQKENVAEDAMNGDESLPDLFQSLSLDLPTLTERFRELHHWQDRYRQIMLLGKELPSIPGQWRTENARLQGCESTVWLHHHYCEESMTLLFAADSEARIIRGLIALVLVAVNGKTPSTIETVDLDGWFMELDLFNHLSPSRGNGLKAIVTEIQSIAHRYN